MWIFESKMWNRRFVFEFGDLPVGGQGVEGVEGVDLVCVFGVCLTYGAIRMECCG